jgi:hypothetical protein
MQVQYRETKTGFDCIHLPSIDISSLQDAHGTPTPSPRKHRKQSSAGSGDSGSATRRIVRKASKLSFGMGRRDKDRATSEATVNGNTYNKEKEKEKEKELPGRPSGSSGGPAFGAAQSSGSSSFFNVSSNAPTVHADDASATLHPTDESPCRSHSPARGKNLPPIPRDLGGMATPMQQHQGVSGPTGEVGDREAFESVGQNTLSVRFEINIVKVCVLSQWLTWSFDSDFFFFVPFISLSFALASLGSMVAVTWYPSPSRGRRWMAISDARTSSPDRVEALTRGVTRSCQIPPLSLPDYSS